MIKARVPVIESAESGGLIERFHIMCAPGGGALPYWVILGMCGQNG